LKLQNQQQNQNSLNQQDIQSQIEALKLQNQHNSLNQQNFENTMKSSLNMQSNLDHQNSTDKQSSSIGGGVKMAKKKVAENENAIKTLYAKVAEHEVKMDQLVSMDDFNLYYNDILNKLDGKVDKVEIFNVVDQSSQLKEMLDNIRQSQDMLTESQQRIKESQDILYQDHENTKQTIIHGNSAK